jgi:hypothetical protein
MRTWPAPRRGKLRVSGTSLGSLRESVDQFTGLVNGISAHSFWVAVAYTKKRIQKVLRGGAKRSGDVVVTL